VAACRAQRLGLHLLLLWEGLQVESQRMLLWAGKLGKAEEFMDAFNYRHFQKGKTASDRATVLEAAAAAGLDADAANAYRCRSCFCNVLPTLVRSMQGRHILFQGLPDACTKPEKVRPLRLSWTSERHTQTRT
jgi:hypothetical protein